MKLSPQPDSDALLRTTRRHLFRSSGLGIGAMALGSLLNQQTATAADAMQARPTHFAPKAKAVIYLFMAGGPSQLDLFSDKPMLRQHHGQLPPKEFMEGKRFAFLKGTETLLGSAQRFARWGNCGQEISHLLPHHRRIADEVCWLHGMQTNVFNHGPAKLFMNTGSPQPGRPAMGAWVTYGIGSESRDLPGFVVL
ncbi:MAG: DUF1501 domain-containing protein, partial [Planctomycetaceae bacterium]|nr:DUF1501 domain-containing protein [Planctomycetaceae bacterium]